MDFDKALTAIYDAAFDRKGWQRAAIETCSLINGVSCFVQIADIKSASVDVLSGHGLESLGLDSYAAYYHQVDIWKDALIRGKRERIHLYHEMVDQSAFEKSEVFNDWVKPGTGYEVFWGLGGTTWLGDDRHIGVFALHRSKKQGAMLEDDRRKIETLLPHVRRALFLGQQLQAANERAVSLQFLCDRSSSGVLLVDVRSKIKYANKRGLEIVGENDGLHLNRDGVLAATRATDTQFLHQQIAAACFCRAGSLAGLAGPIRVARSADSRPLVVTIGPVPEDWSGSRDRLAVVTIEDVWRVDEIAAEKIVALLGITPAEARLVATLSTGVGLQDAARKLGISYYTARAHLRSVLARTGMHRQTELLLTVSKLV